jgi:hypothetical protein
MEIDFGADTENKLPNPLRRQEEDLFVVRISAGEKYPTIFMNFLSFPTQIPSTTRFQPLSFPLNDYDKPTNHTELLAGTAATVILQKCGRYRRRDLAHDLGHVTASESQK